MMAADPPTTVKVKNLAVGLFERRNGVSKPIFKAAQLAADGPQGVL
jgi:hypothetical protein